MMRHDQTTAEIVLWRYLSNNGMCGVKFRRQHPLNGFIVDFYCPSKRLAIELDGEIHLRQKEQDKIRQGIIENEDIRFLRFNNEEVLRNIENVLRTIKRAVAPSPRSGEGCPPKADGVRIE